MIHNNYSISSTSDDSHFLLEFSQTATRRSLMKIRLWHPQELRQRNACREEAQSQFWVNERSWWPCKKTCSTAVDVAVWDIVSYKIKIEISEVFTRYTKMVQHHMIKVQIYMVVSNPPLEGVLDVFDRFVEVLINLTRARSNIVGHWYVCKRCKVIIINLQDNNQFGKGRCSCKLTGLVIAAEIGMAKSSFPS